MGEKAVRIFSNVGFLHTFDMGRLGTGERGMTSITEGWATPEGGQGPFRMR